MSTAANDARGMDRNLTSYGDVGFSRFVRKAFLASAGYDAADLDRPIIGITNTASDYNTCHQHVPALLEAVKRGVLEAGGLPFVFPTASLHEILFSPTTMLFRNLMAMETEELLRAQPMDGAVLVGGCDKTVPAQLMAAASVKLPAVCLVTGPMMTGAWRGRRLGACTDCRSCWAEYRAGQIGDDELAGIEANLCSTGGTCMVMGTASTMAAMAETMGLMVPRGAAAPAVSAERLRIAVASGRQAVHVVQQQLTIDKLITPESIANALTVLMAVGGSTNAIIHLTAIARRAGVPMTLDDVARASAATPLLVDCKPSGEHYMEDFHRAGGVPPLLKALQPLLDLSAVTISGNPLGQYLDSVAPPGDWQSIIRPLDQPLGPTGSLIVLRGSLAPDGAVLKVSAASESLLQHRGPAVVFESADDAARRLDDPSLNITPDHVMVLRNAGPAAAGMPEAGSLPIPRKLARAGVRDMVRISDARMSGTAYGTVILHCCPEAARGGPLALVRDGDMIELHAGQHRIDLIVDDNELAARRATFTPPALPARGWARLYAQHVQPAHLGADLDFLAGP